MKRKSVRSITIVMLEAGMLSLVCLGYANGAIACPRIQTTGEQEIAIVKPAEASSTVGFPRLIYQHVIEGPKVIAKPIIDRTQPVIVRIVDTYPHGSDFRYDIEYKVLEPGNYNIADFLVREDKSELPIPAISVEITSLLGAGQVVPKRLPAVKSRFRNFYSPIMIGLGVVWVMGLIMILFYGHKKKKTTQALNKPATVADRLRPLIDLAMAGKLESQQKAELERVLSAFWCKRLGLEALSADELRRHLRQHAEASLLLDQIDIWIHRPAGDTTETIDVNELLMPYRSMEGEEI